MNTPMTPAPMTLTYATTPITRQVMKIPTSEAISEHMHLVKRITAEFMRRLPRSVQRDDLIAAGTLGLFHALRSSTHTCPEMFAAYARIRIRGAVIDELRRHDWSPRRRKEPGPPSLDTNPARTSPSQRPMLHSVPPPKPRVTVVGLDDLPAHSAAGLLTDEACASPLDDILARREQEALHAAVEELPPREAAIVRMRYFQDLSTKAIARAMGLSEARISQLHTRATLRLKDLLTEGVQEMKLAA